MHLLSGNARDEDHHFHAHPIHQSRPTSSRSVYKMSGGPSTRVQSAMEYGDNGGANHLTESVTPRKMPFRMRRCLSVGAGISVIW